MLRKLLPTFFESLIFLQYPNLSFISINFYYNHFEMGKRKIKEVKKKKMSVFTKIASFFLERMGANSYINFN